MLPVSAVNPTPTFVRRLNLKRALVVSVVALGGLGIGLQFSSAVEGQGPPPDSPARVAMQAAMAKQLELEKNTPQLQVTEEVLKLVVPGHTIGETVGVAKDSKGRFFVFSRSGTQGIARGGTAAELFEFDQDLKFVKQWGPGNYAASYAHAVRVDKYDNVWAVDEGANMILKFSPDAQVAMVLGRKPESIDYLEVHLEFGEKIENQHPDGRGNSFGRPTDVAWDSKDNIFVSDGYFNSRVVKIAKDGTFVKAVGSYGSGPNQFNLPHTIAVDNKDLVYVGDRGNRRIQVFDNDLNPVKIISTVGAPWGFCTTKPAPGEKQYLFSGDSGGKLYKIDVATGEMVGWAQTSQGLGQAGCLVHQLVCDSEKVLYKGDCSTWKVEKITFK